jgi:APA family basic amino acid/polyamine antiporter
MALARRLGLGDAVFIGMGSMIGAGIFAVFAPAAAAAGPDLLIGLVIAAAVAYCNATASAQLAAQYPTSGGTYVYGRERLGEWWGFLAGWSFVIGKTASCAAMALTFATYAVPSAWQQPVAVTAVLALAAVNYRGVTRTAQLTRVIVTLSLVVLAVVVIGGLLDPAADRHRVVPHLNSETGWHGVLQSAGLLFFAFAGYARIATMGEEVREPGRTIPRAIHLALVLTVIVYALVAATVLGVLGSDALATSSAPLADALASTPWRAATPLVRIGAATASLGALLALIAGVGRTTLAMARNRDLPHWLAAEHPRFHIPHRAEMALAASVCVVILVADLRSVIGFSSVGILLYYLIANLAGLSQDSGHRRFPKALQVLGAAGCVTLVVTLPLHAVLVAAGVIAAGIAYRLTTRSMAGTAR